MKDMWLFVAGFIVGLLVGLFVAVMGVMVLSGWLLQED